MKLHSSSFITSCPAVLSCSSYRVRPSFASMVSLHMLGYAIGGTLLVLCPARPAGADDVDTAKPPLAVPAIATSYIVPLSRRLHSWRSERMSRIEAIPMRNRTRNRYHAPLRPKSVRFLTTALQEKAAQEAASVSITDALFPSTWKWSGDRQIDEDARRFSPGESVAESWRLGLDAPVVHPWGTAKITASLNESRAGTASTAALATADNTMGGTVAIKQDLRIGTVTGSTQIALTQNNATESGSPTPTNGAIAQAAEGTARLRWQMTPAFALTGSHQTRFDQTKAWAADDDTAKAQSIRNNSDIGMEWKWSKQLSFTVGAGQTTIGQGEQRDGGLVPTALNSEQRTSLAVQHRTAVGSLGINLSRHWNEETVQSSLNSRYDVLALQGERRLLPWLSLKGTWRFSGQDNYLSLISSEQAQREAQAQIKVPSLGLFALRYADWQNSQSLLDGGSQDTGAAREYGMRYDLGQGKGLGLSVEYSVRQERAGDNTNNWRLGVTYR